MPRSTARPRPCPPAPRVGPDVVAEVAAAAAAAYEASARIGALPASVGKEGRRLITEADIALEHAWQKTHEVLDHLAQEYRRANQ